MKFSTVIPKHFFFRSKITFEPTNKYLVYKEKYEILIKKSIKYFYYPVITHVILFNLSKLYIYPMLFTLTSIYDI